MLVHVYELSISSVEQHVAEDFHVGTQQTGSLGAVWRIPFGLGALLAGWLADRFGSKPMLVIYLAGCAGSAASRMGRADARHAVRHDVRDGFVRQYLSSRGTGDHLARDERRRARQSAGLAWHFGFTRQRNRAVSCRSAVADSRAHVARLLPGADDSRRDPGDGDFAGACRTPRRPAPGDVRPARRRPVPCRSILDVGNSQRAVRICVCRVDDLLTALFD